MKAASLFVLLPLLLACNPEPSQTTDTHAPRAAVPDSHATDAAATGAHAADASAADVHAGDEAAGVAKAAPANGWATDAPLREAMGRMATSMEALGHYEHGHLGAEQALVVAGNVEKDVNYMIANCKLDPDADAALHGIIAKLMQGAQALKANPADVSVIAPMHAAMAVYARDFDDPAFRAQAAKKGAEAN